MRTQTMAERKPAEVFPPGDFIKEELEARDWTQGDLADILARPPRLISELICGKRSITPETAHGLAAAFGTSAEYWMNLETAYQLHRRVPPDDDVAHRSRLYSLLPIKEMTRRRWIEPTENVEVLEQRAKAFMDLPELTEQSVRSFRAAARSSGVLHNASHAAWLARARNLACTLKVPPYRSDSMATVVSQLKKWRRLAEETQHISSVLGQHGIRFVVVEPLPHSKIDGACFWLGDDQPVIALSLRFDRIDAFWFTLLHELGHVRNKDGQEGDISVDVDLVGDQAQNSAEKTDMERAADEFAAETLLPEKEVNGFIASNKPLFSKTRMYQFASRMDVNPGIVAGRLHFRKVIPYTHSRDLLVKVRDYVITSATTDGWGIQPEA